MRYLRVLWKHEFPDEPIAFYSELDDDRWEKRKVVQFKDGHYGYASAEGESGYGLALIALPEMEEFRQDPQYEAAEIGAAAFEVVWRKAHEKHR